MFVNARAIARIAQRVPFRLAVAVLFLALHFYVVLSFASDRFGVPWNRSPDAPPVYVSPADEWVPRNWDRLAVARWDSAHYISLALRGYSQCPPQRLSLNDLAVKPLHCNLNFYPGYPALGALVMRVTHLPADYALLGLSVVASLVLLFLWTDPIVVRALGVGGAYASLLAFNFHTTGFSLVTIQTEPCAMVFSFGAFLAFCRRRLLLAGALAGAATAMRITAAAIGAAVALAIVTMLLVERPARVREWIVGALAAALSVWGLAMIMGYHWLRYGDPLLYEHAHAVSYGHTGSLASLLDPKTGWLLKSMCGPMNEGVVFSFVTLLFLLGHREAMRRFDLPQQVLQYGVMVLGTGLALVGSIELSLAGMNRYIQLFFPLFFAMGALFKDKLVVFAFWLAISQWHYRQADLCDYLQNVGGWRMGKCSASP